MARSEEGSALVIALLIAFILSLLGISFVLMGETENLIARNEERVSQAFYAAEAGARVVTGWFDRPGPGAGAALGFPADFSVVDRTRRSIVDEDDPYGAVVGSSPMYKQEVDLNADGADDLFERPYRGGLEHSLRGREDGPDMHIDDMAFLDALSDELFGSFPDAVAGIRARIRLIEVYAPPYSRRGAAWSRYGLGTVKVTAGIYRDQGAGERPLAVRTIRVVFNEAPYRGPRPYGPVHACGDLSFSGLLPAHWGGVTAIGEIQFDDSDVDAYKNVVPESFPHRPPPGPRVSRMWTDDPDWLEAYMTRCAGASQTIEDPWLTLVAGGRLSVPPWRDQPYPWEESLACDCGGAPPSSACSSCPDCSDWSHMIQNHPVMGCPEYDYDLWKAIATSGGRDVYYYAHDGGDRFRENGTGDPISFYNATIGRQGLFFFDTEDGRAPHDDDDDGTFDNLTPAFEVGGSWHASGFIYLNARAFTSNGPNCDPNCTVTYNAPGEPYLDVDGNGSFSDPPDRWINFDYDTALGELNRLRSTGVRDARGPDISASAAFHGIFYTAGSFETSTRGNYYGSVIAKGDVLLDGSGPRPELYWDARIGQEWPPAGWKLPRVFAGAWFAGP